MARCPNCEKTHQYSVAECLRKDTAQGTVTDELTRQQLWDKKNREKMNAYRIEKTRALRRRRKESRR